MERVVINTKVGGDGTLQVRVPLGANAANLDVQITVEPAPTTLAPGMTQEAWRSFILSTAGSIDDPTFERAEQGEFEQREALS